VKNMPEPERPTCPHCKGELEVETLYADSWLQEACAILKCKKCGKKYDLTPKKEEPETNIKSHYTYPEYQK
jgi:transcription elongation factor Elf1